MRAIICTLFLLVATALAGCVTDEPGSGSASVYVKDAPTDEFKEIHLNFTKVEIHYAGNGTDAADGGEGEEGEEAGADDPAGWRVLFESDGTDIDLLNVTGELAAFLGEASLEAGRYTQVRITVDSAWGIKQDDSRVEITVSSGVVRTSKSFVVPAGGEARIVIDVDLDRSLIKQGGGGGPGGLPVGGEEERWRMTPVIGSITVEEVEDDESGSDVHAEGEVAPVASA